MNNLKLWLTKCKEDYLIFSAMVLVALFIVLSYDSKTETPEPDLQNRVDTEIPKGFVLSPLDIQNKKALRSLIGSYGLVDLYSTRATTQRKSNAPIARSIKIIRAPFDENQFAALVPQRVADKLNRYTDPFVVVVKNPEHANPHHIVPTEKTRKIIILNGEKND